MFCSRTGFAHWRKIPSKRGWLVGVLITSYPLGIPQRLKIDIGVLTGVLAPKSRCHKPVNGDLHVDLACKIGECPSRHSFESAAEFVLFQPSTCVLIMSSLFSSAPHNWTALTRGLRLELTNLPTSSVSPPCTWVKTLKAFTDAFSLATSLASDF